MNSNNISLDEYITTLDKKMWMTRGCRYNTDRRLKKKNNLSLTAISFLSFYVLIISLIPFLEGDKIAGSQDNILSTLAIILSLFILILSLLEASKEYSIKAERLYSCANKINELMSQLKIAQATIKDTTELEKEIERISRSYHSLISSYEENHEDLDLNQFKIENRKKKIKNKNGEKKEVGDFDVGLWDMVKYKLQLIRHFSLYYICIILPPIILILAKIYLDVNIAQ